MHVAIYYVCVFLFQPQPKTGGVSREAEQLNDDDDDKLQLSELGKVCYYEPGGLFTLLFYTTCS